MRAHSDAGHMDGIRKGIKQWGCQTTRRKRAEGGGGGEFGQQLDWGILKGSNRYNCRLGLVSGLLHNLTGQEQRVGDFDLESNRKKQ